MTTIRDIARLAECSVTTVSRVLNNHPYVADEKRKQILSLIKELDYFPNARARELSRGLSKTIGVMIPHANVPYYEKIISGILKAAFKAEYKITLLPTDYDLEKEKDCLEQLAAKAFDGLIITSKLTPLETIQSYLKYGPIVCCEDTGTYPISCVSFGRMESYQEVFRYFKQKGTSAVGIVIGRNPSISPSSRVVLAAYQQVFGQPPASEMVYTNCQSYTDGLNAGLFFSKTKKIDAILTNSDEVAAGILQTLNNPIVEIIGEENLLASKLLNISTIDHHLDRCGEAAFQLVFKENNSRLSIPYTFIQR
ncbi:LacI family DNA-binding transcriptional regulator [Enterococcus sp. LJL128]